MTPLQEHLELIERTIQAIQSGRSPFEGASERTLAPHTPTRRIEKLYDLLATWQTGYEVIPIHLQHLLKTPAPLLKPLPLDYPLSRWWRESFLPEINALLSAHDRLQNISQVAIHHISKDPSTHMIKQQSAQIIQACSHLEAAYEKIRPYIPTIKTKSCPQGFINIIMTLFTVHLGRERLRALIQ